MLEMIYDSTTTITMNSNLQHNLIISYMKLVIEFVGVGGLEHLWAERNSWICLAPGFFDLQKFMSSDSYHLTASALAQVCPSFQSCVSQLLD